MKPNNWSVLPAQEKKRVGDDLLASVRGRYILSQALVYAIEALKSVPVEHRQKSNIDDMEILYETQYNEFAPDRSNPIVSLPLDSLDDREAA